LSELTDEIGDLWDISLDVLGFYHRCCYNCQPREDGEYVWLSEKYVLGDELKEIVIEVCEINHHKLLTEISYRTLEESLRKKPFICPNCETEHVDIGNEIGGEWLVRRGEDTNSATYLLTRTYWSYLTHYTKTDEQYPNGLERLCTIINDGVIRGTSNMIEGNKLAVCFSECSPIEIYEMLRIMGLEKGELPHRRRGFAWRRSKHGKAIKRNALIEYGARPVLHGEATIREKLGEDELWRFKMFDPNINQSDWTFEREFRVAEAIRLDSFDPLNIILLVENGTEQFRLLAKQDVPMYAIVPFDYVYSTDSPSAHLSDRQRNKQAERFM